MKGYDKITKGWFSLTPCLNYNRHMMIITGQRSTGKSTGTAIYLLMDWLENKHGWIYTRRTKDETDLTCSTWFDNAADILRQNGYECEVEYKGGEYYVNGELAGWAIPLSQQQKRKGDNLSLAWWIIYDEFISFDGRYLGTSADPIKEYRSLMSLFQTADRGIGKAFRNEIRIIALGNNDSYYNPLYMALGVDKYIKTDTHFLAPKNEEWMVMQLREDDDTQAKEYKNSIGYKLSDERTREYAYENLSKEATAATNFIIKSNDPMAPLCNVIYEGYQMGIHINNRKGYLYVSPKRANTTLEFALTTEDHKPNYTLCLRTGNEGPLPMFRRMYELGQVRFENQKCKYCLDNYLRFTV